MTKIGLRDRILLITLLPTLVISLCLGGYFSYARYQDQAAYLEEQASNIAEPLAVAAEHNLLTGDKVGLLRLLNVSLRKNAPMVRTIAVFSPNHQLIATSNQHKDFAALQSPAHEPMPKHSMVQQLEDSLLIKTPIQLDLAYLQQIVSNPNISAELGAQLTANEGRLG